MGIRTIRMEIEYNKEHESKYEARYKKIQCITLAPFNNITYI